MGQIIPAFSRETREAIHAHGVRGDPRRYGPPPTGCSHFFRTTLPAWGATRGRWGSHRGRHHFYPRSPRGERPRSRRSRRWRRFHFYPRSPRGERLLLPAVLCAYKPFLSTLPAWGATCGSAISCHLIHISIHVPRVGSDFSCGPKDNCSYISIHAPRVGSDTTVSLDVSVSDKISIHAPRVGSDRPCWMGCSTIGHFYPRSPRGERRKKQSRVAETGSFLSTLPAWGATRWVVDNTKNCQFLSTLPAWGATDGADREHPQVLISIHAPRVGSDSFRQTFQRHHLYFYPRSPRGERRLTWASVSPRIMYFYPRSPRGERRHRQDPAAEWQKFLSTLPAWGATNCFVPLVIDDIVFLSTLPAWGATYASQPTSCPLTHFYPRSPRGERLLQRDDNDNPVRISIHAPRVGSDGSADSATMEARNFYPRSPRGERL